MSACRLPTGWPQSFMVAAALVVLSGCGAPEAPPADPGIWQSSGDRAYKADKFVEAERFYRAAFSLLDPRADKDREQRGALAFATGRSLARAVRSPEQRWSDRGRQRRAFDADGWLRLALHIDPDRGWAHLQQARLYDSGLAALDDPEKARAAYTAFLAWHEAKPPARVNPPADDDPKVVKARERLAALTAPR